MKTLVAPSTWKSRKSQWRCYVRFCVKFNLIPLPCSDDQLSLYATHLSDYMCYMSIVVYLQAVIFGSKLSDYTPPCVSSPSVKLVLEGTKRNGGASSTGAAPATLPTIKRLFFFLNLNERINKVFWASCLLMFFSLLRVSHVTESRHNLLCSDLTCHSWGFMLRVRSSKTHRGTTPLYLPVCKIPDKRYCPVHWITSLLPASSSGSDRPLFEALLGRRYTYSIFRNLLNNVSVAAGMGKKFSGHSFRKGGALHLVSLGVPLHQVKERGNWKSMCVLKYLTRPISDRVSHECSLASRFS